MQILVLLIGFLLLHLLFFWPYEVELKMVGRSPFKTGHPTNKGFRKRLE